nr:fibronectin type III domain-containing protein [Nakamurella flavida]
MAVLTVVLLVAGAGLTAGTLTASAAETYRPAAPAGVTVSTAGLPAGAARLTWQGVTAEPGTSVTGYTVGRSGSSRVNPDPWSATVSPATRSWVFHQLVPGQNYRFFVAAADDSGHRAGSATVVDFRFLPAGFAAGTPEAPTMPALQQISRDTVALTWLAPDSDGGSTVTSYLVSRDGTSSVGTGPFSETISGPTRRKTFTKLVPGRSYTFTVVARNAVGASAATSVRWTVPTASTLPAEPVYAIDERTRRVVRVQDGAAPVTLGGPLTDPVALAVDRSRTVYVADAAGSVVRIPADGSATGTVGAGWQSPQQVEVDDRGNVFVVDGGTLTMVAARDGRSRVLATGVSGTLEVDGSGRATVFGEFVATTYPSRGDGPVRSFELGANPDDEFAFASAVVARTGQLWAEGIAVTSATRAHFVETYVPGSPDGVEIGPPGANIAQAADGVGTYFHMVDTVFCPPISEATGACTPDPTVDHVDRYAPGTSTDPVRIPTSGLTLPFEGMVADLRGNLVVSDDGGLYRVPAQGGPATLLLAGTFSAPVLASAPVA